MGEIGMFPAIFAKSLPPTAARPARRDFDASVVLTTLTLNFRVTIGQIRTPRFRRRSRGVDLNWRQRRKFGQNYGQIARRRIQVFGEPAPAFLLAIECRRGLL